MNPIFPSNCPLFFPLPENSLNMLPISVLFYIAYQSNFTSVTPSTSLSGALINTCCQIPQSVLSHHHCPAISVSHSFPLSIETFFSHIPVKVPYKILSFSPLSALGFADRSYPFKPLSILVLCLLHPLLR